MEVLSDIFEKRKNDSRWNTSYPLSPDDWKVYRISGELSFSGEKEMSFYIHIPFCKGLCSFCEYTRMLCPSEELQEQYIATLKHDIWNFSEKYYPTVWRFFRKPKARPFISKARCHTFAPAR